MRGILWAMVLGAAAVAWGADFRMLNWGMKLSEVKKAENTELMDEGEGELVYHTQMDQVDVVIRYNFDQGQLVRARYEFAKQYRESEKFMDAYEVLQGQLEKKYGAPLSNEVICGDDFYRGFPQRWGTGVVVGRLSRVAAWATPKLLVKHEMRALIGGRVGHFVEYRPYLQPQSELQSAAVYSAL